MPVYDVDGNGSVAAFTDALMILRYFAGQRGDDLTANGTLIGVGATRTTGEEIEDYIKTIWLQLDVCGEGIVDFSDGLLILKYMVGLTGPNLTDGAIPAGAIRDTAEKIMDYLERMTT